MKNINKGSCLCGKVTFEIVGNFDSFFICHCKHCQKDTGSAFASNLFSTNAKLKWLSGESNVKNFTLSDTRHAKSFCIDCGSALPSIQDEGKLLMAPAGSLDSLVNIKPNSHIFMKSKAQWESELDDLETFNQFPS